MPTHYKYTEEQRLFIVTRLAIIDPLVLIRKDFEAKFGRELSRQSLNYYAQVVKTGNGLEPELSRHFTETRAAFTNTVQRRGLACKWLRIQEKQSRHDRLTDLVDCRAGAMKDVPAGGETGLLKLHPSSKTNNPVYVLDSTMLKELRALEDSIAKELGELGRRPARCSNRTNSVGHATPK